MADEVHMLTFTVDGIRSHYEGCEQEEEIYGLRATSIQKAIEWVEHESGRFDWWWEAVDRLFSEVAERATEIEHEDAKGRVGSVGPARPEPEW